MAAERMLQWGHDFSTVEIAAREYLKRHNKKYASMVPRFFNRGNRAIDNNLDITGPSVASMGPRFFNRGNILG